MKTSWAAIGLRVKTGRAVAVMLAGPAESPRVLARRAIDLCDPAVPESRQPYHAALELSEQEGAIVVRRAVEAVRKVALRELRGLVNELSNAGDYNLRGIGLVVGSDTDAGKISNAHIRAHALEGRLFREVLEAGAKDLGLPCLVVVERDAFTEASVALGRTPDELKQVVAELGRVVGRPWGAEEKTASLAAWMALVRKGR